MKRAILFLAGVALLLCSAASAKAAPILFYGGDFDQTNNPSGLANERNTTVGQASTYQNFIVPAGQTWTVQTLFSNNLIQAGTPFSSADWSIRSGVSAGNGGTVIASGNSPVSITLTGRPNPFGLIEETFTVSGLSVVLMPGTYWFNVTPVDGGTGRSFNSNTFGLNSVGSTLVNQQFFNSTTFGANFQNSNDFGPFGRFSDGLTGLVAVPEPTSLALFGMTLAGASLYRWRRRKQPLPA